MGERRDKTAAQADRSGGRSRTSIEGSKGPRLAVRRPRKRSESCHARWSRKPGDRQRAGEHRRELGGVGGVGGEPRHRGAAPAHHRAERTGREQRPLRLSDLGMTGPYDSVIGRNKVNVVKSMRNKMYAPFDVATGDVRACGVIIDVDVVTGKATAIERCTFTQ